MRASARTLPASSDPERAARIATLDWEALEAEIAACRACVLCERRNQVVPGAGERQAEWMFVGEGPGSEEDKRGEPFVGPAGGLLDNMLAALGLKRSENVYIANAVKCRAPHSDTVEAFVIRPGQVAVMNRGVWHDACRGLAGPTAYYWMAICGLGLDPWIDIEGGPVEVRA